MLLAFLWLLQPASVPPISELGPDALLEPMNVDGFIDSLSKKKIPIKALLLDQVWVALFSVYCSCHSWSLIAISGANAIMQSYISGIGNWIADEVLYQVFLLHYQHSMCMSPLCVVGMLLFILVICPLLKRIGFWSLILWLCPRHPFPCQKCFGCKWAFIMWSSFRQEFIHCKLLLPCREQSVKHCINASIR